MNTSTILTQEDIDTKQELIKHDVSSGYHRVRWIGISILCCYFIIGYFIGFSINSKEESIIIFQLLNNILFAFGITTLLLPSIIGRTNVKNLYYHEYNEANPIMIHNCTAYANMPNMEHWKQYINEVKKQNRKLTNHECNLILKDWNSFITD